MAKPPTSNPERIPGTVWRNSQLSLARHYGEITINGARYKLDRSTDELVRTDVYAAAAGAEKKRRMAAERRYWETQLDLFDEDHQK